MNQYNRVRLCTDKYKEEGVTTGDIGYIIEVYNDDNFEIEFSNKKTGETIAQIVVNRNEIELAE